MTAPPIVVVVKPVAAKAVLALLAIAVVKPLCEAVIVEAFSPKVTPFALLKVSAVRLLLVVPADTFSDPPPALTLTEIPFDAMVPEAFVPAKTALACTKSLPRFDAIAVVR